MNSILFKNANVILGESTEIQKNFDVMVQNDLISQVSQTPLQPLEGMRVIDVKGKTLMPGLIDAHAHVTGLTLSPKNIFYSEAEIFLAAATYLKNSLFYGFTTLREAGGADFRIAQLLDNKSIPGPRLFYSGRALTQTGGGADFRKPNEQIDPCGHVGSFSTMSVIADGVDEVRKAAREELRKGATQLKVFASGGVVFPSLSNPTLYEYSEEELSTIVEEARARNTYVMAHAYSDESVRKCIKSGVRSIEHANFVSEPTVELMSESGVFYDPTFISLAQRIESAEQNRLSEAIVANLKNTIEKGKKVYEYALKYKIPIAFGTDLWGPEAQRDQLREFEMRKELDSAANIIRSATVVNAELLMQKGKLGVISAGAYADLLVVDGNPLVNLNVLLRPDENLKLIMKDGVIYKNEL
ncbi:amidohydrolase family protein [Legionella pneumophila serogroup 1]|uniref:metal-dependent hydrolase family protein n=1 Tax=Legionella pneumophila TaxID=446 RepID=UPI0007707CE8|nr:amidohydrolase family protein [Legionella pneumophila]HAT8821888.1 amidohydrolase family protein [Legionella pneumophila subsp. pneumophila]MCH9060770.1 amidohydrolase family protein [Legionella pneumophila serogroup 1]MCH9063440.1 amidohydrolase family protein [Legionella pneumophila serogroup 1]MCH9066520.1 amidohydrolase family protein [Legionella pneumophila serogroup 1]MCH9069284.1 amidohydrolase family protein [Legionella pneumophila serogroup 1]